MAAHESEDLPARRALFARRSDGPEGWPGITVPGP